MPVYNGRLPHRSREPPPEDDEVWGPTPSKLVVSFITGRLSVIVVSIISGEPSDPRPTPILRLKLLSELSKGRTAGPAAAPKGLGSTPLRTRHRPTHPTDSPDRDSRRSVALKRAQGAPQRPYSGSLGFPGAGGGGVKSVTNSTLPTDKWAEEVRRKCMGKQVPIS